METKLVQKKKAGKNEVVGTGSAQYENGKLKVPYVENGEVSMKTAKELKKVLDKKGKVDEKNGGNAKQKAVHKERKVADDSFRANFVDRVVKNNTEIESIETDDRIVLKYKKFQVCRIMVRVNSRMCVYRKTEAGARDTIRIKTEADEDALYDWVQKRVEFLKSKAPKQR